jgi:hypothetical protein
MQLSFIFFLIALIVVTFFEPLLNSLSNEILNSSSSLFKLIIFFLNSTDFSEMLDKKSLSSS